MTDASSRAARATVSRGRCTSATPARYSPTMPAGSADCIVTSPPYWGKRDYGVAGQYGHEDTPAAYVETMRDVFREARRVLADDGTCWLNLGDSYSASGGGATGMHAYLGGHITTHQAAGHAARRTCSACRGGSRSPCRTDGWILRNAIMWHKPNAMPESVRDRLACRHELLFLLVKQPAYWFDLDPIRVPHKTTRPGPPATPGGAPARRATRAALPGRRSTGRTRPRSPRRRRYGYRRAASRGHPNGRNPGDVWAIPTRPYSGPHFAAYPIDLPLRCIAAGCKPGGTVLDPFAGSGTTGLAAIQLGRRFTGIDISPDFARLAAGRLARAVAARQEGTR